MRFTVFSKRSSTLALALALGMGGALSMTALEAPAAAQKKKQDGDNAAKPQYSKAFVAAYEEKYGAVPGTYAMQAYDAAQLIDSAIKAAGGDLSDKDAIREGLKAADFTSLRGDFKIGPNHYPIQDFYLVKVAKRDDGKYQTQIEKKIFDDYADNYAKDCKMN